MKRKNLLYVLAATMVLSMGIAGCGGKDTSTEGTQAAATQEETFTVTFFDSDGTTELKTEKVNSGECVAEYVPEKEGFVGWFATPGMTHRFDFSTPITADTQLFGGFVTYQEDTREFAVVGSGTSPVLMESNWGKVIGDAQKMTKEDTGDANIYTITLDLNEGDEFQFAINSAWNNQRGYGYLDTITKDGVEYFANSGGLGETSTKRANIKCAVAGNYTFTLTTYPGEDIYETDNANYTEDNKEAFNINPYDVITWTYNGESTADNGDMQTDYYIKGAKITGWEDVYSDETKFTEENGIYTLTVDLEKDDEFMFTSMVTTGDTSGVGTEYIRYTNIAEDDTESLSYVTGTETANLIASQGGTYTFTYDPSTQILTVKCE